MDIEDLVERLCTMAGMIMEDAAPHAILRDGALRRRIERLADTARDITALSDAVARLALRLDRTPSE